MASGLRTTYTDLNPKKQAIVDMIDTIDPMEAPLLHLLGVNKETMFKFVNWGQTRYEWLEDTLPGTVTALDGDIDGVVTAIVVDDASIFSKGMVLMLESEYLWVSSITNATTFEAVRGWGGTTAAAHSGTPAVTRIMTARAEGSETILHPTTNTTKPYNFTQILGAAIEETGTQSAISEYGKPGGDKAYHIAKLLSEGGRAGVLAQDLQRIAYYGVRADGATDLTRGAGGLDAFLTANRTDKSGGALAATDIEQAHIAAWKAGGAPSVLVCNIDARVKISSFFESTIRTTRDESMGGHEIESIRTHAGDLQLFTDRWCPDDMIYILDTDRVGWVTLRPFDLQERPANGDFTADEYIGEYGFVGKNAAAHAVIENFDPLA